jgi:hypothetical protein
VYSNVDYDLIKHLIKENTTPGKGKAVSIPGTGQNTEREFEQTIYDVLVEEHERIGLFVKSKVLEITRRLRIDALSHSDIWFANPTFQSFSKDDSINS